MRAWLLGIALGLAAPAVAGVTVGIDQVTANNNVQWWSTSQQLVLPATFSNAVITLTRIEVDDLAGLYVNGTPIMFFGQFGSGAGFFYPTSSGGPVAVTALESAPSVNLTYTAPFVAGLNEISFIVNNSGLGINPSGGPLSNGFSFIAVEGTVSYAVPEPASWALLIAGFGLIGAAQRRRRTLAL